MKENISLGIPVGIIVPFAGKKEKIPQGWLLCNGDPVSKDKYPQLFEAIGANWGGDANPNFYLPDLRGKFLRGVSYDSSFDSDKKIRLAARPDLGTINTGNSGNEVGSLQLDAIQIHKHNDLGHTHSASTNAATKNQERVDNDDDQRAVVCGDEFQSAYVSIDSSNANISDPVSSSTAGISAIRLADETRPVNAYVNYIIKY
jgi:microcystin-dependent protein